MWQIGYIFAPFFLYSFGDKMRIHSLSKVLILPLVIAAIVIFYYAESTGNRDMTVWIFVPGLLLTAILVFYPQIDYWWHEKYPLPLDPKVKKWLQTYSTFYKKLDRDAKIKYEQRLSLYMEAREFKSVGSEVRDVPEDLKGIIGSIPVMMTMNRKDFLLGDYDRIYLYKHPFPSPRYHFLHTAEINREDGVLLFALEYLLPGITRDRDYYNICLHGFAEAYIDVFSPDLPAASSIHWEYIQRISKFREEEIKSILGMEEINMQAVLITCFFTFPEVLKKADDDLYHLMEKIFWLSLL